MIKNVKNFYKTVFVFISCVLFLFFVMGLFVNPNGSQRNIFFAGMNDFFADFFNVLRIIDGRDPYFSNNLGDVDKAYFPLTYMILYPFSQLDSFSTMSLQETWNSKIGLMSVFLFIGFSIFLLFLSLNKIIKKYSISSTLLIGLVLSYIFFFTIERGNIIILAAAFIGFFINFYDSENKNERIFAMISLAIAATLKVYPVLFGFLYFEKKQYREIFLSAVITLLLIFLPYVFFKRGFANIIKQINNVRLHSGGYNYTRFFPRFSLPHLVFCISPKLKFSEDLTLSLSNAAQVITYILSFVSILFSCLIKNKWVKISLLTMVVVFLPTNSAMYCGLYIFPMIILFFATLEERSKSYNVFITIVFIILLSPYQIVIKGMNNYIFINIALLSLWFILLAGSGKNIIETKALQTGIINIKGSFSNLNQRKLSYLSDKSIIFGVSLLVLIFVILIFTCLTFLKDRQNIDKNIDKNIIEFDETYKSNANDKHIGEITKNVVVKQTFLSNDNNLCAIKIMFATFMRINRSTINIKLYDESDILINEEKIKSAKMLDNSYLCYEFANIGDSRGKKYTLVIFSDNAKSGNAVTIWCTDKNSFDGDLFINDQLQMDNLCIVPGYGK